MELNMGNWSTGPPFAFNLKAVDELPRRGTTRHKTTGAGLTWL